MVQMPNPITKNTLVRKSSGLKRDHLPTNLEIQRLLSQDSEILPLIKFLIFTGARLGEVLHLELDDIKDGVWMIKSKPNCMTKEGIGWAPKWEKSRMIPLFERSTGCLGFSKKNQ